MAHWFNLKSIDPVSSSSSSVDECRLNVNEYLALRSLSQQMIYWVYLFRFRPLFVLDFEFLSGVHSSRRILLGFTCGESADFTLVSRSDDILPDSIIAFLPQLLHLFDAKYAFLHKSWWINDFVFICQVVVIDISMWWDRCQKERNASEFPDIHSQQRHLFKCSMNDDAIHSTHTKQFWMPDFEIEVLLGIYWRAKMKWSTAFVLFDFLWRWIAQTPELGLKKIQS